MVEVIFADRILIAAAIAPAIFLFCYVYKKDTLEKEPIGLLVKLALWGIISTALASISETVGIAVLPYVSSAGSKLYNILLYFIVVALSEEGFKYLLLKWKTWRSTDFNCQFDGVVYAVFVSLGFALWENISYCVSYGFSTAVARALTAVPGHACFGVFMGTFYGAAKRCSISGDKKTAGSLLWASLLVPTFLHGMYDYLASTMEENDSYLFFIFVIVFFVAAYKLVKKLSENDRYISTDNPDGSI